MTAIIVTLEALSEAESLAGAQWGIALSPTGAAPATHRGCNWVGCPQALRTALAALEGVSLGEDWTALCADAGLARIAPEGGQAA